MPLGYNRVLGDRDKSPAHRPHRVALAWWPTTIDDPRSATFEKLVAHAASRGYEGVEFGPVGLANYFSGDSPAVVATKARRILEKAGLENFGSTFHRPDAQLRSLGYLNSIAEEMRIIADLGGQFASMQFFLHEDYLNTGGVYREDDDYLQWCADRITQIREKAWSLGLNFYLEVHIGHITEDPAACCRLLELTACELNGDMSHYIYRGITKGRYVDKVMQHVGHTHVRMARQHGDLSAAASDPRDDWQQRGVTWQMFDYMKKALAGGLSSRTIAGETGPMHLVQDSLTQDALLVPLYCAMARYADAAAQGITMAVQSPDDLGPWG